MNKVPFEEIRNVARDANEMWILWKSLFLDILNKHAPITNIQVKGNIIPYVTSELKSMIRQRDYLRAKANKTGSCILRQAYNQIRTKVNQKLYLGTSHRLHQLDEKPESTPYIIMIDGGEVRRTKCVKYLGMLVDDKLTWASILIIFQARLHVILASWNEYGSSYPRNLCYYFIIP